MKKIISFILAIAMCLSFCACSEKEESFDFSYFKSEPWGSREVSLWEGGQGRIEIDADGANAVENRKKYSKVFWEIEGDSLIVRIYNEDITELTVTDTFNLNDLPANLEGIQNIDAE